MYFICFLSVFVVSASVLEMQMSCLDCLYAFVKVYGFLILIYIF